MGKWDIRNVQLADGASIVLYLFTDIQKRNVWENIGNTNICVRYLLLVLYKIEKDVLLLVDGFKKTKNFVSLFRIVTIIKKIQ